MAAEVEDGGNNSEENQNNKKQDEEELKVPQDKFESQTKDNNDEEVVSSEVTEIVEERFRVDRKKLENLLQLQDEQNSESSGCNFFRNIEQATNTTISWPAKLKIGAKSKKDPYIKVAGLPEDRLAAKQMVLSVMDTKSTRVTLKMDVSFTDHSHIIGKGGNTIKKVMKDTQCHIHFPDSNRTSSEKSNQVSIAGPPFCVESARRQIRELLPIVLKFEIPSGSTVTVPDSSSPVIANIAQSFNVTISFQQQLRSYGYIGCVKGLHSDPFSVRDAVLKVLEHLTGTVPVTVHVTTQMEVDPKHHVFIFGRNGCNVKKITQSTGASIHFPDPNDPNMRKSTVTITGSIEAAVTAKVYLLQFLPLILMFDIRDGENEHFFEQGVLKQINDNFDVQVNVKPKPKQFCKSIIVKSHEKNALNIYKTRLHLIGEDPSNMPFLLAPLATLVIPPDPNTTLNLYNNTLPQQSQMGGQSSLPNQGSPLLSPPVQSSSPLVNQSVDNPTQNKLDNRYLNMSPVGQRIIGSEMKMMKRLSIDGLMGNGSDAQTTGESMETEKRKLSSDGLSSSRSAESILDALMAKNTNPVVNKEIDSLALSGSWNRKSLNKKPPVPVDSGPSRSQDELNESSNLSLTNLMNNLALQRNPKAEDYELRKKMAKNAMHSQVQFGKVRTPTDAWAGLGFSNSMPEAVITELLNREKNANQLRLNGMQNILQPSPTTSLDSSVSSNGSSTSAHSHGMGHQSPSASKPLRRPPPGLEDSHPSIDNSLLLNNNYDYGSMLSPPDHHMSHNAYANVKCMSDLFAMLGLEQYIDAFDKEEVDLSTFMSLTDEDLKELGVSTFGARKKMANAMKELQAVHNHQALGLTTGLPSPLQNSMTSLFPPRPIHNFDIAAHSLRW